MTLNTKLTLREPASFSTIAEWDDWLAPSGRLEKGAVVDYVAHVFGGAIKVRHEGQEGIIDPRCTVELS